MIEDILKQVGGASGLGDKAAPLVQMLMQHLGKSGADPQALIAQLGQAGLGDQLQSWIGTGANQPINGDQAEQALGSDFIQNAASQLGLSPDQVKQASAEALPAVVDKATPNGQADDMISGLMGALGGGGDLGNMAKGLLGNLGG